VTEPLLRGRTALITGGTSGIGAAVAQCLAQHGARLVVLAREAVPPRALREPAGAADGFPPLYFQADIRRRVQLRAVRAALEDAGVLLNIVVANAGTALREEALHVADDDIRSMIDTNVYGTFITLQEFAPMLAQAGGGRVVVTSSVSAVHGMRLRTVYSATKAALSGLVRSLAIEWGPLGITVNAVGPGIIRTRLLHRYIEDHPEQVAAAIANTPLGRLGEPDDVAEVVAFLASDDARFITGQTLFVDGGLSAGDSWW
jgi:gluconate 5-dehydrogenase